MPRIMQVTIVNIRVNRRLCPPIWMMVLAMFRAKPVMEQTPTMQPTQAQAQQPAPQPFDLIIAVSGRNGAEAFQMPPNSRAVLFDDKQDVMYRVSTDGAGYKTVTEFDFSPREAAEGPSEGQYATKADLEALMERIDALAAQKPVPRTRKAAADGE